MNSQPDPTIKSRDLDLPLTRASGNRRGRQRVRFRMNAREAKLANHVISATARSQGKKRRRMYIDVVVGIASQVTIGNNTTSAFGAIVSLTTALAQGVAQTDRMADQVWIESIHENYSVKYNFAATGMSQDYCQIVREGLLVWKDPNNLLAMTPASIYQNVTNSSVYANFDFELTKQYRVIKDDYFSVCGFGDATTGLAFATQSSVKHIDRTINMGNHKIDFTPGATTGSGHVYATFTSDSLTGPPPILAGVWRIHYYNTAS